MRMKFAEERTAARGLAAAKVGHRMAIVANWHEPETESNSDYRFWGGTVHRAAATIVRSDPRAQ